MAAARPAGRGAGQCDARASSLVVEIQAAQWHALMMRIHPVELQQGRLEVQTLLA